MSDSYAQFEKRINGVTHRHKQLADGYTAKIGPDGLITLSPKPVRSYVRIKALTYIVLGFFLSKAVALHALGVETYQSRVDMLAAGTAFEKICAYVMEPGPITTGLASYLAVLF